MDGITPPPDFTEAAAPRVADPDPAVESAPAASPAGPAEPARRDAPEAAGHWLSAARRALDAEFGPGYAAANPTLVAAFLQACALDSAVQTGRASTDQALAEIARLSRETNATILKLKPRLFG